MRSWTPLNGATWATLKNELGDLLFQVLFHSKMADEIDAFNFEDVCDGLVEKMVSRHPHVFEGGDQPDWDAIKAAERKNAGHKRTLDGVAKSLPALMRAEKLQKRAAKRGFDWPDTIGPVEKLREEIEEVSEAVKSQDQSEIASEIGDLLFSVVNLARKLKVEPEHALRVGKFQIHAALHLCRRDCRAGFRGPVIGRNGSPLAGRQRKRPLIYDKLFMLGEEFAGIGLRQRTCISAVPSSPASSRSTCPC